jgi:Uncharacterized conserved protein (DUF2358)
MLAPRRIALLLLLLPLSVTSLELAALTKILKREYASFFAPMERSAYETDVSFLDPLTSFSGIDKYQSNVDMLGGRTTLGNILFQDSSINMHNLTVQGDKIVTRWTLRTTVKFLPWKPTARFTGISEYSVGLVFIS